MSKSEYLPSWLTVLGAGWRASLLLGGASGWGAGDSSGGCQPSVNSGIYGWMSPWGHWLLQVLIQTVISSDECQKIQRSRGWSPTSGCSRSLPGTATAGPPLGWPLHSAVGCIPGSAAAPQWSLADPRESEAPPGTEMDNPPEALMSQEMDYSIKMRSLT